MKLFKKKQSEIDKQIAELDEFINATEPTSDEYDELISKKRALIEIKNIDAEANKANAEGKNSFFDSGLVKIIGAAGLAYIGYKLENKSSTNGKLLNNFVWQKFKKQ